MLVTVSAIAAPPPARPKITGIANIAVKSESLAEARRFYSGVVGMDESFTAKDGLVHFKVNDRQFVEVLPELKTESEDRLIRIGFETSNARQLRDYLASKGVAVPAKAGKDANGNLSFVVNDPEGHAVQFVEYLPGSLHGRDAGKHLSDKRLSDHILHVGIRVIDPAKADGFYRDILGFRLLWKGGRTDTHFDWISMLVPGRARLGGVHGDEATPTPQQLGVCITIAWRQRTWKR